MRRSSPFSVFATQPPNNRARRYVIDQVRDFADETLPDQTQIARRNCLKVD